MTTASESRRQALRQLAALAGSGLPGLGAGLWPGTARAEAGWPRQPLRFVVPFTAGSGTDVIARSVGERLEKMLGQPIIVDNRPGAGGTLGAALVAGTPADGYTVLVHSAGHVANAALYQTLKYDTQKDFTPITTLATLPNVLVTAPAKGYKSVQDLVAKVRAKPDTFNYASAGNGSATHINAEKFRLSAGLQATHVPYRGTPEALNDVMGGRVDWFFAPLVSALSLINDGKLQALAVGSAKRSAALPQLPTTLEAGFAGSDYSFWVGMFVPARTPAYIVSRLHEETVRTLELPELRARLVRLGADVAPLPQAQFASLVRDEQLQTASLIKAAGIRLD